MTCQDCKYHKACLESNREYPCREFQGYGQKKPDYANVKMEIVHIMAQFKQNIENENKKG